MAIATFLSCLCGSEQNSLCIHIPVNFLSCLCGSEQKMTLTVETGTFLSCLCGSELTIKKLKASHIAVYRKLGLIYPSQNTDMQPADLILNF